MPKKTPLILGLLVWAGLLLLAPPLAAQADGSPLARVIEIDIQAQPLGQALLELGRLSDTQILAPADAVDGLTGSAVRGRVSLGEALSRLLQDTGLNAVATGANTISIEGGPTIPLKEQSATPPADATVLDEITVTATRRVKSQRDIPASVNALSGDYLEKIGAQGLKDYLKLVPGVSFVDVGAQDRSVPIIRGIATNVSIYRNSPLGVGVFVDDIPFNDLLLPSSVADANPFDMERVEVLKGPQSTLFGAGVLSGAIRYITRKPDLAVWNGKLQTSYTQDDHGSPNTFYGGALNIPVYRDEAAVRLVGLYREDGGLYDFVPGENSSLPRRDDVNKLEQYTGRLSGVWNPTERLGLQFTGFYQQSDTGDQAFSSYRDRYERTIQPIPSQADSNFSGSNLIGHYDFDWGRLESSTSYLTKYINAESHNFTIGQETFTGTDGEPGNDPGTEDQDETDDIRYIDSDVQGVVQEFRVSSAEGGDSRWEWLGGLAYMNYQQLYRQRALLPGTQPLANEPNGSEPMQCPTGPVPTPQGEVRCDETQFQQFDFDADIGREIGLYGEATRKFFDDERLEVTLGGRLFRNTLGADIQARGVQILLLLGRTESKEYHKFTEDGFNPKISALYKFNRNVQAYALAAKGFQFGGIQLNPRILFEADDDLGAAAAFLPYESSKLWNYELGLRTEFFDRRLRWDTVLYQVDWEDMQITQLTYAPHPNSELPSTPQTDGVRNARIGLLSAVQNLGGARSQGVETALELRPLAGLSFTSSMGWTHAVTTVPFDPADDVPDGMLLPPGTRLPGSPNFQIANVLAYARSFPALAGVDAGLSLTHTHLGTFSNAFAGGNEVGGYDLVDASLSLVKPDWRVAPELSFIVRNIADVRGASVSSGQATARDQAFILVAPRTALLSLGLKF